MRDHSKNCGATLAVSIGRSSPSAATERCGDGAFYRDIPPLDRARVTAGVADCAVRTAQELGADMAALGAASGLNLETALPDEIPVAAYLAFLDAAARQLNDPLFGLRAGLRARVVDAKAYSMVLMACRNGRALLEQVSRFEPLAHDVARMQLIESGGIAHLRIHSPWTRLPGIRQFFDYAASSARVQSDWLAAMKLPIFRFSTTFDPPDAALKSEYERLLGCPVQFGAAFNEMTFPSHLLSLPMPSADESLFAMFLRIAADRLASHRRRHSDEQIVAAVRARLREEIILGRTNLPDIAASLGLTPRTLQRKLSDAQATFAGLLDEVRREEVKRHLLDHELSLTEVALLLGYGEQSTFNHAFRTWFGTTPGKYRRALLSDDAPQEVLA